MKKFILIALLIIMVTGCSGQTASPGEKVIYHIEGEGEGWSVDQVQVAIYEDGRADYLGGTLNITKPYDYIAFEIYQLIGDKNVTLEHASYATVEGVTISKDYASFELSIKNASLEADLQAMIILGDNQKIALDVTRMTE